DNLLPFPLSLDDRVDDFAHRAATAGGPRHEGNAPEHFVVRVRYGHRHADAGENRKVGHIVTHVTDLGVGELQPACDTKVGLQLVAHLQMDLVHPQLLGATGNGDTPPSRDDPGAQTDPPGNPQPGAILDVI